MTDPNPNPTPPADSKPSTDPKPESLGDSGKKALESEREARKAADARAKQLEQDFADFKATLADAFGVKPEKGKEGADLGEIQSQVAALQRNNAVLALANQHGITDAADIKYLNDSQLTGDALSGLAERLKPAEQTSGTPKPDPSQGGHGTPVKPDPGPGLQRLAAAFEDQFASTPADD